MHTQQIKHVEEGPAGVPLTPLIHLASEGTGEGCEVGKGEGLTRTQVRVGQVHTVRLGHANTHKLKDHRESLSYPCYTRSATRTGCEVGRGEELTRIEVREKNKYMHRLKDHPVSLSYPYYTLPATGTGKGCKVRRGEEQTRIEVREMKKHTHRLKDHRVSSYPNYTWPATGTGEGCKVERREELTRITYFLPSL